MNFIILNYKWKVDDASYKQDSYWHIVSLCSWYIIFIFICKKWPLVYKIRTRMCACIFKMFRLDVNDLYACELQFKVCDLVLLKKIVFVFAAGFANVLYMHCPV